jgi:hypothetical protein
METGNNKGGPERSYGRSVRISVWRNNGLKGSFPSFRIERRYKDTDGTWKSSNSMTMPQLLRLQALIARAVDEYLDNEENGDDAE